MQGRVYGHIPGRGQRANIPDGYQTPIRQSEYMSGMNVVSNAGQSGIPLDPALQARIDRANRIKAIQQEALASRYGSAVDINSLPPWEKQRLLMG